MLAALLANIRLPGGRTWAKSQADRERLLKEDKEIIAIVTTLVTSGVLNG